jgi:protein TonB
MARRPATPPRLVITPLTDPAVIVTLDFSASERLAAPPPRRWHPWTIRVAWAAAVLLHLALIALLLLLARHRPAQEQARVSPPGVSVVFENGGAQQTAAPPAPRPGPTSAATVPAPPPPPPPPPPQQAETQPEVNLNMPSAPFATMQNAPEPMPMPQPPQPPRPLPRPHTPTRTPPQRYLVMNDMSFGKPAPPTPPIPHAHQALSLNLPQSDAQAVNAPEVTIKGHIGADWEAELSRWVNDHKYYPEAAAEQGQQGYVRIEFIVDRSGHVTGLRLLGSSGSPFLDQAWLGLFAQNQLPPFPPGTKANHITVDATMHFELIP